jgi:hypothetical protein
LLGLRARAIDAVRDGENVWVGIRKSSPQIDICIVADMIQRVMDWQTEAMQNILDRLDNRSLSGGMIGTRGKAYVSYTLKEYARSLAKDDKKKQRSIRSAAEMDMRVALNFVGTARGWESFPESRFTELRARCEELNRMSQRVNKQYDQRSFTQLELVKC